MCLLLASEGVGASGQRLGRGRCVLHYNRAPEPPHMREGYDLMTAAVHLEVTVQPDGKIEFALPDLIPGQRVRITIEIPDGASVTAVEELAHALDETSIPPRRYTALELMKLPLAERHRILEEAAEEAAEEYRTNPDLTEFDAFGEDDLYDDHPE